uniref:Uncharacterized protein n=3 Tax=Parascaris univalens TaxID=6257 RepID=A0A914ZJX3_PARUN
IYCSSNFTWMNREKESREAITPTKDSPVRSVVGDIFTTSYYLMRNSYENVEGMLKLLECDQRNKRINVGIAVTPSNSENSSPGEKNKIQPNNEFNNKKKDLTSSTRRFQSNVDLTNLSKGFSVDKTKIDLPTKSNENRSTKLVDPNIPICRLIGPIRIQTAERIVYTEYGEAIIEERIELIGYGRQDKTKPQIRLKPLVKRVTPAYELEEQPDTKQTVLIADNYIRINRSTRLKKPKKKTNIALKMPIKYTETRQFTSTGKAIKEIRNSYFNKKHRPVLTARSETALDAMRVYNLIGPLEVTAKQEVTNDDNNGYTISETLELRAANSKAAATERLVPLIQKKQEAAAHPDKRVPCKRNERIFIGDNVISIDRIIRLSSPQSMKSFSLVEHRGYICDTHTAREKSPERLMTAKSYGNTLQHYSMNSFDRSEDSMKQMRENREEESDDVHTAKSATSQTLQEIYGKQASTIKSKYSLEWKNAQKVSRKSPYKRYQRELSSPLRDVDQSRLIDNRNKAKLGLDRETKQKYSPQTATIHKSRLSGRSSRSTLLKRSEPQTNLRTARRLPSTNAEALGVMNESSPCEYWLEEANIKPPDQVIRELDGVAYYVEKSLQAAIQRAHSANRCRLTSATSTKYNGVDKSFGTTDDHQYNSNSEQQQNRSKQNSQTSLISKKRTLNEVNPKFTTSCASDTINANLRYIDPELRNQRKLLQRRIEKNTIASIRLDLLQHTPSMFDEEIKTSRSPGCCTERKLQENSSRAVASDSPRNYFGSNESDEQCTFGFFGMGRDRKESMMNRTSTVNQGEENNLAGVVRISSGTDSLAAKRNATRNHSSTTPSRVSAKANFGKSRGASSRSKGNLNKPYTTQHPLKQRRTEISQRENTSRAEVTANRNNIVIEALDDRGMTIEVDLSITMKDPAGKIASLNGNFGSHIRRVMVNGRQFCETKRDK